MIKTVSTKEAPTAIGPYSQAKVYNGLIFVSGQLPVDPKTNQFTGGSIQEQAEQSILNASAILEKAGSGLGLVLKTTCYLASMNDFAAFNTVYDRYFPNKPARSCFAVYQLPKDALCEIELIAVIGESGLTAG